MGGRRADAARGVLAWAVVLRLSTVANNALPRGTHRPLRAIAAGSSKGVFPVEPTLHACGVAAYRSGGDVSPDGFVSALRKFDAQVYILGRMGNAAQALRLIVERLADIPQAIAFVQGQDDEDLWQLLISLALGSAATAGAQPCASRVRSA